ncbi:MULTISPECIES: hypothetical protein [unclassified Streptomyces]|uniref:hypothetical protein n=1 Tax=unclassified Streptomyces TaxID=2593676 RepID=UPI00278C5FCD|nr:MULTISPECIES: hypothetical protein [unclassified Streptomyces]
MKKTQEATEARDALVHLGVCSAPVAHELAAVITRGAAPKQDADTLSARVAEANALSRKAHTHR